ncbi:MAG: molecular chaperone TorD family protein [Thermoproteus sp.]|jgi:TorA maturation chaperone TorD|nr:molecular chaperone TorD family protein [Thermoproteus sp.]MDT7882931.1 molecular chaperone TorD family protein [Thermoproteus sp.]
MLLQLSKQTSFFRSILYDFLSSVFIYPYRLSDFQELVSSKLEAVETARRALAKIYDFKHLDALIGLAKRVDDYDDLTPIEVDLTRIDYAVPPFEGYLHTGYLDLSVEEAVKRFYAEYGAGFERSFRGLRADHISVELAFMSYLAFKEQEAEDPSRYLEGGSRFLTNHLLTWVPVFVRRALKHASTEYVREALLFTREFLRQDRDIMEIIMSEDEDPR